MATDDMEVDTLADAGQPVSGPTLVSLPREVLARIVRFCGRKDAFTLRDTCSQLWTAATILPPASNGMVIKKTLIPPPKDWTRYR